MKFYIIHQQDCRNTAICEHIKNCKTYKSKFKHFKKPNNDPNLSEKQQLLERQKLSLSTEKLKYKYFTTHFKILQKNFRSLQHRLDAEAFFLRMKRPSLNKQEELSFFDLFWNRHVKFLVFYYAPIIFSVTKKVLDSPVWKNSMYWNLYGKFFIIK